MRYLRSTTWNYERCVFMLRYRIQINHNSAILGPLGEDYTKRIGRKIEEYKVGSRDKVTRAFLRIWSACSNNHSRWKTMLWSWISKRVILKNLLNNRIEKFSDSVYSIVILLQRFLLLEHFLYFIKGSVRVKKRV